MLQLYYNHLLDNGVSAEQVVYLNFEDYGTIHLQNDRDLYEFLKGQKVDGKKMYFLFDEIQDVENWQKLVNGLRVTFDCDITITGSNAKMLSGEMATYLAGRYIEIRVFPLSFKEFAEGKLGKDYDSRKLPKLFDEYIRYGGFPAVALANEDMKDTILSGIVDTVLLNDIASRGGVRDINILKRITRFLADNIGQFVSHTKIANTLTSANLKVTKPTAIKYVDLMEDAFLFYPASRYDIRGKEYLYQQNKFYIVDSGLRHNLLNRKADNRGSELENIVYIELLRRGYTVDVGKIDTNEIDFIARRMDEILYIQVALELANDTRETDNLLHIRENHQKMVITQKLEEQTMIDGIPIVNVIDWLLKE